MPIERLDPVYYLSWYLQFHDIENELATLEKLYEKKARLKQKVAILYNIAKVPISVFYESFANYYNYPWP